MIDCVIPAAGASSRMGAFKPLLPFGSGSIVETTVGSALAAGCRVILVVGHRGAELAALFAGRPGLLVVENPGWERGMLGSLQAGIRRVESREFFTIPADMPLVPPSIYKLLLDAAGNGPAGAETRAVTAAAKEGAAADTMSAAPAGATLACSAKGREQAAGVDPIEAGKAAYFAAHDGRAGHPVLIPSAWIPEMLELPPSGKMRSYLEKRRMILVEAGTDAVFADLDGPEEYRAAVRGAPRIP